MFTTTDIPKFNADEIILGARPYFQDQTYNGAINLLMQYFPYCVTVNKRNWHVTVKSRVSFTVYFSGNETKFYIMGWVGEHLDGVQYSTTKESNQLFRVFDLQTFCEWAFMKKLEDNWIQHHEG
jgi:hypothetical protein